jgi:hypothetical protein
MISADMQVEELLRIPGAMAWCIQHGVSPFSCAGAFPASLGRLLEIKHVADPAGFIELMNQELVEPEGEGEDG